VNPPLEAALYYASIGWAVFPLAPGQKTPRTSHGCKDATYSPEQIKIWWSQWHDANVGLACGAISGVYVVDIDVRENCNGFESFREFPGVPVTVRQDTPSGGAHLFFTAAIAPPNANKFRPGIDIRGDGYYVVLPPSTHPNGGTYSWTPGYEPWSIKLADYPDCLRLQKKLPSYISKADSTDCNNSLGYSDGNTLERAGLYLSQCDPAIQGLGGHNALLWAAVAMVHGFSLTESQALDLLLREYNPRCNPPWDVGIPQEHKDFCRKVSEAKKLVPQQPEGWLLNDPSYFTHESSCKINVSSLLSDSVPSENTFGTQAVPAVQTVQNEYEFLIRPTGLLGKICSWINATALREQPFLALACALAFMGSLFGRKVKDAMGSRTNLYCMGVSRSSGGKMHAISQIRRLACEADCLYLLGGDDIASDAAIEARLSREPATLYLWDEMGHKLVQIKSGQNPHLAAVVSLLMKVYSAAPSIYLGKEYADKENQKLIVQPCCCIYGTSTLQKFAEGIAPSELQDGWMGRCLVFIAPDMPEKSRKERSDIIPDDIVEQVRLWSPRELPREEPHKISTFVGNSNQQQPPRQLLIPTSHDAEMIFRAFDSETVEFGKQNQLLDCLWSKGEENARRIALIVACGNGNENAEISSQDADYACRLIRYLLIDFGEKIAPEIVSSEIESRKRRIFKIIEMSGIEGCMNPMLVKKTPFLSQKTRQEAITDLIASGEIAYHQLKGDKLSQFHYWTAKDYRKYLEK